MEVNSYGSHAHNVLEAAEPGGKWHNLAVVRVWIYFGFVSLRATQGDVRNWIDPVSTASMLFLRTLNTTELLPLNFWTSCDVVWLESCHAMVSTSEAASLEDFASRKWTTEESSRSVEADVSGATILFGDGFWCGMSSTGPSSPQRGLAWDWISATKASAEGGRVRGQEVPTQTRLDSRRERRKNKYTVEKGSRVMLKRWWSNIGCIINMCWAASKSWKSCVGKVLSDEGKNVVRITCLCDVS